MKPIIIDMNDMTDSSEIYESKQNPWLSYFIYFVLAIVVIGFGWAYFSKIDIVVRANGLIKLNNKSTIISTDIQGRIDSLKAVDGKLVKKGDLLAKIDSEELGHAIKTIDKSLDEINQRIEILKAYESFLSGDKNALDTKKDNLYYSEFLGRKNLIKLNNQKIGQNIEEKKSSYVAELSKINNQLSQLGNQIERIDKAISSVSNLEDLTLSSDGYYSTLVSTFFSNYNITNDKYDKQIQALLDEKKSLLETITNIDNSNNENSEKDQIYGKQTEIDSNIDNLNSEKDTALSNLKMEQITLLEQEKNTAEASMTYLNSNKKMLENKIDIVDKLDTDNNKDINIETEKQTVAKELL